jgi:thioredoxin 1
MLKIILTLLFLFSSQYATAFINRLIKKSPTSLKALEIPSDIRTRFNSFYVDSPSVTDEVMVPQKRIVEVNDNNFYDLVVSHGVSVVMFTAPWCEPCKLMKRNLNESLNRYGNKSKYYMVDIDANSELAYDYEIRSIPTTLVIKNGEVRAEIVGTVPSFVIDSQIEKYC